MIDELNDVVLTTETKNEINHIKDYDYDTSCMKQSKNELQDQKPYLSHASFPYVVIVGK